MKKKGFTVVELLTVIVIIGIMAAIAIPTVTGIIEKSRKQYYKTVEDNLKLAGIDYYSKNSKNRPKNRLESATVSLKDLSNGSYIKDVVDHKGNACDIEESKVVITKNTKGKYDYQACLVCGEEYKTNNAICDDDYNPSNNANYKLEVPQQIYSYKGQELDVNKIEKAELKLGDKTITKVKATTASINNANANYIQKVGTYTGAITYEYKINNQTITKKTTLIIYENQALTVKLNQMNSQMTNYTSSSWTKENVQETITVPNNYQFGVEEIQIKDNDEWRTYCSKDEINNNKCIKKNEISNNNIYNVSKAIRAIDSLGNASPVTTYSIKIDKEAPTCTITVSGKKGKTSIPLSTSTAKIDGWYTGNITIDIKDQDVKDYGSGYASIYELKYDGNKMTNKSLSITSDGAYDVVGYVYDNVGNKGECTIDTLLKDATPPTVNKINVQSTTSGYNGNTVEVTFRATDPTTYASQYASMGIDSVVITACEVDNRNNCKTQSFLSPNPVGAGYYITLPNNNQYNGKEFIFTITATDKAGNSTTKQADTTYTVYKECSETTESSREESSCSVECGGGSKTITIHKKDKYLTNKVCPNETKTEQCNTQACSYVQSIDGNINKWMCGNCRTECNGCYNGGTCWCAQDRNNSVIYTSDNLTQSGNTMGKVESTIKTDGTVDFYWLIYTARGNGLCSGNNSVWIGDGYVVEFQIYAPNVSSPVFTKTLKESHGEKWCPDNYAHDGTINVNFNDLRNRYGSGDYYIKIYSSSNNPGFQYNFGTIHVN